MKIEFEYKESAPCVWKAPIKGRSGFYTPDPYATYRSDLSQFLMMKYHNSEWIKSLKKSDKYILSCGIYKKHHIGDLTNFVKGIEDCMQIAGIIINDKQIEEHNNFMTIERFKPYISVELIKI